MQRIEIFEFICHSYQRNTWLIRLVFETVNFNHRYWCRTWTEEWNYSHWRLDWKVNSLKIIEPCFLWEVKSYFRENWQLLIIKNIESLLNQNEETSLWNFYLEETQETWLVSNQSWSSAKRTLVLNIVRDIEFSKERFNLNSREYSQILSIFRETDSGWKSSSEVPEKHQ